MTSAGGIPLRARAAGLIGSAILRLLGSSWRIRLIGREHERAAVEMSGGGLLYAVWHGQLLPLTYCMRGQGISLLISQHLDGEYIAQATQRLGYQSVRGSTSRGGFRSLVEMVRLGRGGGRVAITPDGPRGPRHQAQPGAVLIARRAGIPILPLAGSVWPRKQLSSWDRFVVPAPLAKVVYGFGPPLVVPPDLKTDVAIEAWNVKLAAALHSLTARTEREVLTWARRRNAHAHPER
ncbi:MAG: lysophospholipid acyltransferase family protein [Candidatus Eisenbacteria sp.]|nr:lysophospholipid acyltransferase family protein [Candidatus Eisenbacteria bacterium]